MKIATFSRRRRNENTSCSGRCGNTVSFSSGPLSFDAIRAVALDQRNKLTLSKTQQDMKVCVFELGKMSIGE